MSIFELWGMDELQGEQTFYKVIVDGISLLDEFEKEVSASPSYLSHFKIILTMMECVANMKSLPGEKLMSLKSVSLLHVREYEFKSGPLRVYALKNAGGKIVVCGGCKNTHKSDIKRFQSLKRQYVESINQKK